MDRASEPLGVERAGVHAHNARMDAHVDTCDAMLRVLRLV
jgi:hypothetical protein